MQHLAQLTAAFRDGHGDNPDESEYSFAALVQILEAAEEVVADNGDKKRIKEATKLQPVLQDDPTQANQTSFGIGKQPMHTQPWLPSFPESHGRHTLYGGLVLIDLYNKYARPADEMMNFYVNFVMTKRFASVDPAFADACNLNVYVQNIRDSWPDKLNIRIFNTHTRRDYKLQVCRDTDRIILIDVNVKQEPVLVHIGDRKCRYRG